jgi:hypothetical protein
MIYSRAFLPRVPLHYSNINASTLSNTIKPFVLLASNLEKTRQTQHKPLTRPASPCHWTHYKHICSRTISLIP